MNQEQRAQITALAEKKFGQVIEFFNKTLLIKRPIKTYSPNTPYMTINVRINGQEVFFHDGHYDLPLLSATESLYERSGKEREFAPQNNYTLTLIDTDDSDEPVIQEAIACASEKELNDRFTDEFTRRGAEPTVADLEVGMNHFEDGILVIKTVGNASNKEVSGKR